MWGSDPHPSAMKGFFFQPIFGSTVLLSKVGSFLSNVGSFYLGNMRNENWKEENRKGDRKMCRHPLCLAKGRGNGDKGVRFAFMTNEEIDFLRKDTVPKATRDTTVYRVAISFRIYKRKTRTRFENVQCGGTGESAGTFLRWSQVKRWW